MSPAPTLPEIQEYVQSLRRTVEAAGDPKLYRVVDRLLGAEMEVRFLIGMDRARG